MREKKFIGEALTFDDVLLVPRKSNTLPRDANTSTRLSRNIQLNIPLVSAAMDTVTESRLAIALAREGGIGILHKNMSIEAQASNVEQVKRSESGMILNPITMHADQTVGDALQLMGKFQISGIPIVDNERRLIGIVTSRDLRFEPNRNLEISQVMTSTDLVTAPAGTTPEKAEQIIQKHRIEKLPVVDGSGRLMGLFTFQDIRKKKQHPNASEDKHGRLRVGAGVGVAADTLARAAALVKAGADVLVVDTAHAHSRGVIEMIQKLKANFPECELIAGNVGTAEAARDLIRTGVDAIKVGIGPGSICTTRVIAGIGVPQITAIYECAKVAQRAKIPVIADGGIRQTGDIAKAIAAGADTVMIGSLFAGVDESPGEKILYEGRSYKLYRGMGSLEAMKKGSSDRYFQDVEDHLPKLVPEGVEGFVPYKGLLADTVFQMIGGLRAAMGYCGCATIQDLKTKTQFVRMSEAGLRESHPHDVRVSKEPPNYHL
ncbi:MAG TPA: IMP dehydrogenase [Bacteroidota bacterium]|nr:IMP dehydrogenase [Bacteroidota bacterium]